MMDTQLIAFAGVSLLLAVTPGPDMAVVTRNALVHGRRGVFLTTSGIALALVLWVAATAIGLSALLRGSSEILFALKVVGACYLAYLGARTLIDSRRRPADLVAGTPAEQLWHEGSTAGANACGFSDAGGNVVIRRDHPTLALVEEAGLLDAIVFSGSMSSRANSFAGVCRKRSRGPPILSHTVRTEPPMPRSVSSAANCAGVVPSQDKATIRAPGRR